MESRRITAPIQINIKSRIDQRAGMTAKHTNHAKIKKAVRRELAHAGTAFFSFIRLQPRWDCLEEANEVASETLINIRFVDAEE